MILSEDLREATADTFRWKVTYAKKNLINLGSLY